MKSPHSRKRVGLFLIGTSCVIASNLAIFSTGATRADAQDHYVVRDKDARRLETIDKACGDTFVRRDADGRRIGTIEKSYHRCYILRDTDRQKFSETLWCAEVDPGELELAVLNLAVNARDAMPEGGTIIIRGDNRPADGQNGEDQVCLSVIDSGMGMSAEVRMRAFEPFFTTKEVGKGSGLGLAQVYGFARQSGGTVVINSEPGEGTTVSILLPRSLKIPAERNKPPKRTTEKPESARTGSALLVEDDDQVAALVSDMLREIGYDITRAASAASALGALANDRAIDIVFSDVMMPGGMDGGGLAKGSGGRRPAFRFF